MSASSQPVASSAEAATRSGPFPEPPRVIYAGNPLVEVIRKVRFPPVLKIETQIPEAFQDQIRTMFPVYRDSTPSTDCSIKI
jgi:hypothetical protein